MGGAAAPRLSPRARARGGGKGRGAAAAAAARAAGDARQWRGGAGGACPCGNAAPSDGRGGCGRWARAGGVGAGRGGGQARHPSRRGGGSGSETPPPRPRPPWSGGEGGGWGCRGGEVVRARGREGACVKATVATAASGHLHRPRPTNVRCGSKRRPARPGPVRSRRDLRGSRAAQAARRLDPAWAALPPRSGRGGYVRAAAGSRRRPRRRATRRPSRAITAGGAGGRLARHARRAAAPTLPLLRGATGGAAARGGQPRALTPAARHAPLPNYCHALVPVRRSSVGLVCGVMSCMWRGWAKSWRSQHGTYLPN